MPENAVKAGFTGAAIGTGIVAGGLGVAACVTAAPVVAAVGLGYGAVSGVCALVAWAAKD